MHGWMGGIWWGWERVFFRVKVSVLLAWKVGIFWLERLAVAGSVGWTFSLEMLGAVGLVGRDFPSLSGGGFLA